MAGKNRTAYQSRWLNGSLQINPPIVIGSAFFVDSANGASTNDGTSWDDALATVDQAVAKCTATKGDVIYCAPWHTEDEAVAATSIWALSKACVSLIGVKSGNLRPTFSFTTNADALATVSAANCRISGVKFISAVVDLATALNVTNAGDYLEIDDCVFTDGAAALEMVIGVTIAAACDKCYIHDNQFFTTPGGGCASAIKLVGESEGTIIAHNKIQGDYSASCIDGTTAAATLLDITHNEMINVDATAGSCVDMHASTTGHCAYNSMMGGKSIADCYIANGMVANINYCTGAVSASGILAEPAADAD